MALQRWICETCGRANRRLADIWLCPGCGKETCELCFDRLAHCKNCAGQSDDALRAAANAHGWDFEPDVTPLTAQEQEKTK